MRKLHFKLRKVLFKKCLERNGKNKNVLEFGVEKREWDFFFVFFLLLRPNDPSKHALGYYEQLWL